MADLGLSFSGSHLDTCSPLKWSVAPVFRGTHRSGDCKGMVNGAQPTVNQVLSTLSLTVWIWALEYTVLARENPCVLGSACSSPLCSSS